MKKTIKLNVMLAVLFVAVTVTFSLTMIIAGQIFGKTINSANEKALLYDKVAELDTVVRQNFFGPVPEDLNDALSTGYVAGLGDKYCKYYTAVQYTDYVNRQSGKVIGIGVDIVMDAASGYARVIKVYNESPAQEAEIAKGDFIVKIDGREVKGLGLDAVTALLQGEVGTQVELETVRGSEDSAVTLVRKSFDATGIEYALKNDTVGYVKVSFINASTAAQFDFAVQQLIRQGATSLVFDMRRNTSANLNETARMLDVLCPEGTLVSAQYSDGTTKVLHTSSPSETALPMVCIMDSGTSAAAEAFCQVLSDYGKAKLVGTATAGRGSIQTIYRLSDGSAVELTTALMRTPKGSTFLGTGLQPDYEATLTAAQEAAYYDLPETDDAQLNRALEVASGLAKSAQVTASSSSAAAGSGASGEDASGEGSSAEDASLDDTSDSSAE